MQERNYQWLSVLCFQRVHIFEQSDTRLLRRTAFLKTLFSVLLHGTTQCFERLILDSGKQTGVI
jgi:hypothetical protein